MKIVFYPNGSPSTAQIRPCRPIRPESDTASEEMIERRIAESRSRSLSCSNVAYSLSSSRATGLENGTAPIRATTPVLGLAGVCPAEQAGEAQEGGVAALSDVDDILYTVESRRRPWILLGVGADVGNHPPVPHSAAEIIAPIGAPSTGPSPPLLGVPGVPLGRGKIRLDQ